jgi:hypothetical protein
MIVWVCSSARHASVASEEFDGVELEPISVTPDEMMTRVVRFKDMLPRPKPTSTCNGAS